MVIKQRYPYSRGFICRRRKGGLCIPDACAENFCTEHPTVGRYGMEVNIFRCAWPISHTNDDDSGKMKMKLTSFSLPFATQFEHNPNRDNVFASFAQGNRHLTRESRGSTGSSWHGDGGYFAD